ncbi:MAG: dimethylarginine dimethylaminohydrolase family protein [Acidiferrobacterales bacterium]
MLVALTRPPSRAIENCELTHLERVNMDFDRMLRQHACYQDTLSSQGVRVKSLEASPTGADAVFVEDSAIVLDEVAILASMGTASRRTEPGDVAAALGKYRPIERIELPATIEGGDVLRINRTLYVGLSPRTNELGVGVLSKIASEFGYQVMPIEIKGALHLKSACTALNDTTLLVNENWIDCGALQDFERVPVADREPFAANVIRLPGTIVMHQRCPDTIASVEKKGFSVTTVDVSEFAKAEGGLTCLSLIFEGAA